MAKHLVTGGSGFLGNLIARRLRAQGEEVVILDIWNDPTRPKDIQFFECDILNRDGVRAAMKGVDVVHHNVALVPLTKSGKRFWDINVEGSRIAAEEAVKAGVKSFIHMSSSAIYGLPKNCPITADTPCQPIEIYGKGKLEGELVVENICKNNNMKFIAIRPRTILGEGRLGIFQILFDWIKENKKIFVIGNGNNLFQLVHAHDLMDAYMLALKVNKPGKYNVGTNEFSTLRDDLTALIRYAGSSSRVVGLPPFLAINSLRFLDIMGLSPLAPWHYLTYHKPFYFDVTPLIDLGWKPKYSNIEMFKESYDWFLKNGDNLIVHDAASPHRNKVQEGILKIIKKLA